MRTDVHFRCLTPFCMFFVYLGNYVDSMCGREVCGMEVDMSVEQVLDEIRQLHTGGMKLNKKVLKSLIPN